MAHKLAAQYSNLGHSVEVITTVRDKQDAGWSTRGSMPIYSIRAPRYKRLRAYYSIFNPYTVRPVARTFDSSQYGVVHAHNVHEFLSYYCLKLAKDRGIPTVLTYHDAMSVEYGKMTHFIDDANESSTERIPPKNYEVDSIRQARENRFRYFPARNLLTRLIISRYVDAGVAVSHELRRALQANDVDCQNVIHNGIDPSTFEPGDGTTFRNEFDLDDAPIILAGGRFGYWKGGEQLAKAFTILAERYPELVLVVTGSNLEYVEKMREIANRFGDRILSTGWIPDETLRNAYRAATVFASPSIYLDALIIMNLEAMASGTPVVTSCFGGAREGIKDGETGIVTNPLDVELLTEDLDRILRDENLRTKFGIQGRQRVIEKFDIADKAQEYIELFKRIKNET